MNERRLEIIGILTMLASLFVLVSLAGFHSNEAVNGLSPKLEIENPLGILGVFIADIFIMKTFGIASFALPILSIIFGWWIFTQKELKSLYRVSGYVLGAAFLFSVSTGYLSLIIGKSSPNDLILSGLLGITIGKLFLDFLGTIGTIILLLGVWLVLIRGYFTKSFYKPIKMLIAKINNWTDERKLKQNIKLENDAKQKHTKDLLSSIKKQENKKYSTEELDTSSNEEDTIEVESGENDESINPKDDKNKKSEEDDSEQRHQQGAGRVEEARGSAAGAE